MVRRRDVRRFGSGPYVLGLRRDPGKWGEGFPFDVPAVTAVDRIPLDAPITLLAGDNGSGKSTIVEAIAEAMGFAAEGGELERAGELPAVPRPVLGDALEPVLGTRKPRNGYFLRAESFFNIASFVDGAAGSRRTCRCTATSPCTSSRTVSRSSPLRPTASGATASTCSTSRRPPSR